MKKTKNFAPYNSAGRCNLTPKEGDAPGVYIIYKDSKPVYVGFSASNLYKTMYRHFQSWNDPTQRRVSYTNLKGITCRVIFTTVKRAQILEEALILKLRPRDNENKLRLYSDKDREAVNIVFEKADIVELENVPF